MQFIHIAVGFRIKETFDVYLHAVLYHSDSTLLVDLV